MKNIYCLRYNESKFFSVINVYKNPSKSKLGIEFDIRDKMLAEKGYGYRILSHNAHFFSCAYMVMDEETGVLYLHVFTPFRNFYIEY